MLARIWRTIPPAREPGECLTGVGDRPGGPQVATSQEFDCPKARLRRRCIHAIRFRCRPSLNRWWIVSQSDEQESIQGKSPEIRPSEAEIPDGNPYQAPLASEAQEPATAPTSQYSGTPEGFSTRYHLTQEDFLAFNRQFIRRNWKAFSRNFLVGAFAGGTVIYLFFKVEMYDTTTSLIGAVVVGPILAALGMWQQYSTIRPAVAKHFANPQAAQEREFFVTAAGVRERTAVKDSAHAWQGVERVDITRRHIFIFNTPVTAYIVPRGVLPPEVISLIRSSVPANKLHETDH